MIFRKNMYLCVLLILLCLFHTDIVLAQQSTPSYLNVEDIANSFKIYTQQWLQPLLGIAKSIFFSLFIIELVFYFWDDGFEK